MKNMFLVSVLVGCLCFVENAGAATYQVGPGKTYSTIRSVPYLTGGDILEIYPGTYNEYKKWMGNGKSNNPIIIRGMGAEKPVIDGKGLVLRGEGGVPRALFEFLGRNYVVENLEFINAYNGSSGGGSYNGAGIRITGGSNITIRNCKITKCENGMMSDNASNISIEFCEIAYNGSFEYVGYSHNLYMGGNNISVKGCYIHDSNGGHNFKTRMHYVELLYNYIADSNSAEVDIVEADETRRENPNAVLIGNIIKKRDFSLEKYLNQNDSHFILFGDEIKGDRKGTLYLINNTIISGMNDNRPLLLCSSTKRSTAKAVCYNNIFYGSSVIMDDDFTSVSTTGYNNWIPEDAKNPPGFKQTVKGKDPGFVDFAGGNYNLTSASKCINAGENSPQYVDGRGNPQTAFPGFEYLKNLLNQVRYKDGKLDIGAYEYSASGNKITAGAPVKDARVNAEP